MDKRLRLTRETGYLGLEAKPEEIGATAEELRRKCDALGIQCVAIGAGPDKGIDYLHAAGGKVLRCSVAAEESTKWVEYAAERGILLAVHPHVGPGGVGTGSVETREDMLRYLEARPGVYACPDTGHLLLCGSDPVQTILDLGERCRYIHLKDIRPEMVGAKTRAGEKFCDIGTGALDLAGVLDALRRVNYDGWIMVETDNRNKDHVQSARNMRKVLEGFGL